MKPSKNSNILKTSINNNGIFKIVLDNSKNHNVLSEEMMQNLQFALDEAASNNKIRVIIISANGSTFSAGHDLKELKKNLKMKALSGIFSDIGTLHHLKCVK